MTEAAGRLAVQLAASEEREARMREALEWYGDPENYVASGCPTISWVQADEDAHARAALNPL